MRKYCCHAAMESSLGREQRGCNRAINRAREYREERDSEEGEHKTERTMQADTERADGKRNRAAAKPNIA